MAKTVDDKKIIYTMDRVSRAYGTKVVLKDVSISYYYGAKIGVIGPNGSGKSSLFKILAGVDKDFTGETCRGKNRSRNRKGRRKAHHRFA